MLENGSWGYMVGTYDKDTGANNQRLYLERRARGSDDRYNIDDRVVQRSDGWIATTWNNMSNPGVFAAAGAEEQAGGDGEPPPLAGTGVVVCLMG